MGIGISSTGHAATFTHPAAGDSDVESKKQGSRANGLGRPSLLASENGGVVFQGSLNLQSEVAMLQSMKAQAAAQNVALPIRNVDMVITGYGADILHGNGSYTGLIELPEMLIDAGILKRDGGSLNIVREGALISADRNITSSAWKAAFQAEARKFGISIFVNGRMVGNPGL